MVPMMSVGESPDEKIEWTPQNIVKLVLVVTKCVYLMIMMIIIVRAYYKKSGTFKSFEVGISTFYFFDILAILLFDFTGKYIMLLYFLLLFSSYATYALYYFRFVQ